jgi:hypothetical protein
MNSAKNLFEYFGAFLIDESRAKGVDLSLLRKGYVLDFVPTKSELMALTSFAAVDPTARTFFSVKDITTMSTDEKILKQIVHYFFVYGCGAIVDFKHPTDDSKTVPVKLIRGITKKELWLLINTILVANKPAKNTPQLVEIIKAYEIQYNFGIIQNHELRVALYRPGVDKFMNGDDAVRYICKVCAESDLLIKSKRVVKAVAAGASKLDSLFVARHSRLLAAVFNRHKRILVALKLGDRKRFGNDINVVARLSKELHRPLPSNPVKTFIADYLSGKWVDSTILTVRDKFKLLNLIEFKMRQETSDAFMIRNGRVHVETNRKALDVRLLSELSGLILDSLESDLRDLKNQTIVLDEAIDYGLPMSRKQTLGQLPFGTKIRVNSPRISSGVYWKNEWGATDIDLSTVDEFGQITGWGRGYSYDSKNNITFSGDITYAPDGAMEFMTSNSKTVYGLFVNIFAGELGSEIELVVGGQTSKKDVRGATYRSWAPAPAESATNWIDDPIIREKIKLADRQTILGFVEGTTFTVFSVTTGKKHVRSEADKVFLTKARSMHWTLKTLLDRLGIAYQTGAADTVVDHDLRYSSFTIDKLEKLLRVT